MEGNNLTKKGVVVAVILLFVSVSVIPSTGTNILEKSSPVSFNGNTLYVGGSGPNNYTKIQDAIDNASEGDTVFVYDDSSPYNESVVVWHSINLIGENKNTTIIDVSNIYFVSTVYIYAPNCRISGFTLTGANGGTVRAGVTIPTNNNIIQECKMINSEGSGILLYGNNNWIDNNIIAENDGYGIHLGSDSYQTINNTISNNSIVFNGWDGIAIWGYYHNGSEIYHNDILKNKRLNARDRSNNTWDNGYPSGGNYWDDYMGEDNDGDGIGDTPYDISGGDNQDLYPLMYPWYPTHPDTVYVDDDYNVSTPGFGYDRFNRIQYGINEVEGSSVYVFNGTYYENVVIDKTLNLIGEDRNTTVIDGNYKGSVITINSDNVVVRGFTLKNIKDYYLFEGKYGCIKIKGAKNVLVTDNIITPGELGDHMYGEGVYLYGSGTDENVIKDNIIFYDKYIGTAVGVKIVYGADYNTIYNNEIYGCHSSVSIVPMGSDCNNNIIDSNYFHDLNIGVSIDEPAFGTRVISNKITNCGIWGVVLLFADDNLIDNNTITHSGKGIYLSGSGCTNNIVLNNQISYNNVGIYARGRHNIIYHNTFINNTQNAYDEYDNTWDNGKSGNYWDDYKDKYPDAKKRPLRPWIWDTPYDIPDRRNKDRYPLVKEWPKSLSFIVAEKQSVQSNLVVSVTPKTTPKDNSITQITLRSLKSI